MTDSSELNGCREVLIGRLKVGTNNGDLSLPHLYEVVASDRYRKHTRSMVVVVARIIQLGVKPDVRSRTAGQIVGKIGQKPSRRVPCGNALGTGHY